MYEISLIQIQITCSHQLAIFHTYDTAIWYVYNCTIIKTQSNYKGCSTVQNNTSYIHQDILIHVTL